MLYKRDQFSQDWLNLLSNICNHCKMSIKKKYIDKTLKYIKDNPDELQDIESIILSKFNVNQDEK